MSADLFDKGEAGAISKWNAVAGMSATVGAGVCCPCAGVSDCGPGVPLVGSPHTVWQQSIAIVAPAFDLASLQHAISAALS